MSPDLKQTLPASDNGLSTTLIQPTTRSRQSELSRTRYWEQRGHAEQEHKHHAVSGDTRIGLGPNDPLVQAVQAVKLQLMQATEPQPTAAYQREPSNQLPCRHLKPKLMAAASISIIACTAAIAALTNKHSEPTHEAPALVRPAPPKAPSAPAAMPLAPQATEPPPTSTATARAAADALFAGDYALAKHLYTTLAQSHPDQAAFSEAARILSRNPAADAE